MALLQKAGVSFLTLMALCGLSLPILAQGAAPVEARLDDGARVICRQETGTPLIAVDVFVTVGAAQEAPDKAGLGSFVARTLFASTTGHTPDTMAQQIGALGGNVNASWQPDWTQISALTVSDQFDNAAYLLTDTLKNADFDAETVEDSRQEILGDIENGDANLLVTAYAGFQRTLYDGSGYALPARGTEASINRIRRADLLDYFHRFYVPKNFVFVIVGNIDPKAATEEIRQDLDDFPTQGRGGSRRDAFVPPPPPVPTRDLPPARVYEYGLTQACVLVGYRAPAMSDSDYPAMLVANALLGGMKSSRLFTTVREKQGLAYELGSLYSPQREIGDVVGYAYAPPTKIDPVTKKSVPTVGLIKGEILRQFESLKTTPPTPAELARAQHFLIGTYKIKHERIEDRATLLGIAALGAKDGAQLDTNYAQYLNAVTAADVQRVANKYFTHPVISTVEPDNGNGGAVKG